MGEGAMTGRGRVLACVDGGPSTGRVLAAARVAADLLGADLDPVLVVEPDSPGPPPGVRGIEVPATGPESVSGVLLDLLSQPDVILAVVGVRATEVGARPAGHVALALLEGADKPILAVPPRARVEITGSPSVLVPLDGDETTASGLDPVLRTLERIGARTRVLHVLVTPTVPPMSDSPYDLESWGREFADRQGVPGSEVNVRAGDPAQEILSAVTSAAGEDRVDLITIAWGCDLSPGRAEVVRTLLSASPIPVLLVPTSITGPESSPTRSLGAGR